MTELVQIEKFNDLLNELNTRGAHIEYMEYPTNDKIGHMVVRGGLIAYLDWAGEYSLEWDDGDVETSDALDYILFQYDEKTS